MTLGVSRVIAHPIVKYKTFRPIVHTRCLLNYLSEIGVVSLEPLGLIATGCQGSIVTPWRRGKPLVTTSSSPYKPNVEQATKDDRQERSG